MQFSVFDFIIMKVKTNYEYTKEVYHNFFRDLRRKKYRNCVHILFQNRYILTIEQFVLLFEELVEHTPCIDYVSTWDINSQYKYYKLLEFYQYVLTTFKD